jgi:hypothetical protein
MGDLLVGLPVIASITYAIKLPMPQHGMLTSSLADSDAATHALNRVLPSAWPFLSLLPLVVVPWYCPPMLCTHIAAAAAVVGVIPVVD